MLLPHLIQYCLLYVVFPVIKSHHLASFFCFPIPTDPLGKFSRARRFKASGLPIVRLDG